MDTPSESEKDKAIKILERALTIFGEDEQGCYISGPFLDLGSRARFSTQMGQSQKANITRLASKIGEDLWNISAMIDRMVILQELTVTDDRLRGRWYRYTILDVEHFHIEFRAILDYAARLVDQGAFKRGQLPESFRKLVAGMGKFGKHLPPVFAPLLSDVRWFWEMRQVRDNVVHDGASTMSFENPQKGILFQVHQLHGGNLIDVDFLMYNPNVVYFEKYCAFYMAHLLVFLNDLADALYSSLEFVSPNPHGGDRNYSPGYPILKKWMKDLLSELRGDNEAT